MGRTSKITTLICLAHFLSHLYYLTVLSSLPALRAALDVTYTDLGLIIAGYGLATTLFQVPLGFAVDRYGAPLLLAGGLATSAAAMISLGSSSGVLQAASSLLLLGLGDAVFHPANYSILARAIPEHHAARAYSAHNFAGQLGFAVAPLFVTTVAAEWDWHLPMTIGGVIGMVSVAILIRCRRLLSTDIGTSPVLRTDSRSVGLRLVFSTPIVISLLVFVGIGIMNGGMRDFGISALHLMYPDDPLRVGSLVTIFLLVSLFGIALGAALAHGTRQYRRLAYIALFVMALACFVIGLVHPPIGLLLPLFCIMGLCSGVVASTRDLVVRTLAPPQHAAKVFGFVSQGIGLASLLAPMLYGVILDHAPAGMVFVTAGAIGVLAACLIVINRAHKSGI